MAFKDPEKRRSYQRDYVRGWHQRNKDKRIAAVRRHEQAVAEAIRTDKNWKGCAICSARNPVILEYHHINRADKLFNIGSGKTIYSVSKLQAEIDKCVVLCANDHRLLEAGCVTL